ncbi:MAG: hypothetical protein K0R80_390 [Clostridia bacterium]|jgi:hypothetical protein|nr:hypothetical protein [Clostridia bacterium]
MKGIIAEIHGSYMIVIAKNGDFIKCKKLPNCNIGDEINIPARNMNSIYKKLTTVAASFLILAMLSSGVYAYYTPYSYVSVDINPSLELYVNRFDKVIGVHAFNEEAQLVIDSSVEIKNKDIDTALEQILDSAAEAGYLKENTENSVMIVVSSGNAKEEAALSNKISKTSIAVLSSISSDYEVILEKTQVENYKKAKKDNISPGKVMLANRFKEVKPDIDEEEIKHMPLQQAIKQIEKKEQKEDVNVKPNKPVKAANQKPEQKAVPGNNVMNIKELIQEKNEDLGNKLEKDNKDKEEKDNEKDKVKGKEDKMKDDESLNQIDDEDNEENSDKQQVKDGQDNKPPKDNSVNKDKNKN